MATEISEPRKKNRQNILGSPTFGWLTVFFFLLLSFLASIAGLGSFLRILFPIFSLVIALFLYFYHPSIFITFNWIIWCFTPLIRRLSDYFRGSFDDLGLILIAPYLVTFVCGFALIKKLPSSHRTGDFSFIIVSVSIIFAFLIGIINSSPLIVIRTFLEWMAPVLFGLYISTLWSLYPSLRKITVNTFLWISLVTGIYGIYQYMVAPPWDTFWLESVENVSFGLPEPQQIRVWSTMNSPPPYGCVMMAALLLLFNSKSPFLLPAVGAGYLSFMLSMVRSAWLGWAVGLVTFLASLKPAFQIRLFVSIFLMTLLVVPLTSIEPFGQVISERLETFLNIQNDTSYEVRGQTYSTNLGIAMTTFIGQGLGSTFFVRPNGQIERIAFDSGILDTFFTLGWLGGIPYLLGIFILVLSQYKIKETSADPFVAATKGITNGFLTIFALGPFMIGLSGMVMWGFLGFGMAARKYYSTKNHFL